MDLQPLRHSIHVQANNLILTSGATLSYEYRISELVGIYASYGVMKVNRNVFGGWRRHGASMGVRLHHRRLELGLGLTHYFQKTDPGIGGLFECSGTDPENENACVESPTGIIAPALSLGYRSSQERMGLALRFGVAIELFSPVFYVGIGKDF